MIVQATRKTTQLLIRNCETPRLNAKLELKISLIQMHVRCSCKPPRSLLREVNREQTKFP